MPLAILFHFLCAQHVSDISISIVRNLRLCCWITTSVAVFSVRCVLEILCGWVWVVSENTTTDVVIQQQSRKLLMMDILMSETCWEHKKWNKIASDIKLVFYSSIITMMQGPINIRFRYHIHTCWPFQVLTSSVFNPLHAELNPICHLLALLGAHHILHASRIRVKNSQNSVLFTLFRLKLCMHFSPLVWDFYNWTVLYPSFTLFQFRNGCVDDKLL